MTTHDARLIQDISTLPEALRPPIEGVSLAAFLFVEAARLDELPERVVLAWLGVGEAAFARTEEQWNERVSDELARDGTHFDTVYEGLLGRALSLWARPVDPLDGDVEAWIAFQRHALEAENPGHLARQMGLTPGDELRLALSWRERLSIPEIARRALEAWSGPLAPLPRVSLSPIIFPPHEEHP